MKARDRYPNLAALVDGVVTGVPTDARLRTEAGYVLAEVDRLRELADELIEAKKRPDYFERGLIALGIVILIGVFLLTVRFGMRQ